MVLVFAFEAITDSVPPLSVESLPSPMLDFAFHVVLVPKVIVIFSANRSIFLFALPFHIALHMPPSKLYFYQAQLLAPSSVL